MFGKGEHSTTGRSIDRDPIVRGGVSFGPVLTGVVVAFGAMFLLSAIVGGVLAGLGVTDEVTAGETVDATVGAGIALVVAQLLAYLWGGYTAGRMSRGAGLANGLLVPLIAILMALAVGAVATALGATANLNLPFTANRLPLENDFLVDWGVAIGIASLLAMFIGGAVGGLMGARWHTKLERRAADEHDHAHDTPAVPARDPGLPTGGSAVPTSGTRGQQPPPAPAAGRETDDIGTQPARTGVPSEEGETYTQRSSGDTQTFRS